MQSLTLLEGILLFNSSIISSILGVSNVLLSQCRNIKPLKNLFIGVGTGLCGCLTSFSAWANLIGINIVYNGLYLTSLFMLLIGPAAGYVAYMVYIYNYLI